MIFVKNKLKQTFKYCVYISLYNALQTSEINSEISFDEYKKHSKFVYDTLVDKRRMVALSLIIAIVASLKFVCFVFQYPL